MEFDSVGAFVIFGFAEGFAAAGGIYVVGFVFGWGRAKLAKAFNGDDMAGF